jgi:hypothetical protein
MLKYSVQRYKKKAFFTSMLYLASRCKFKQSMQAIVAFSGVYTRTWGRLSAGPCAVASALSGLHDMYFNR